MSSKEEHAAILTTEHARAAKQDHILKGPPATTFSATHPAYTYTSSCPDRGLREPPEPWRKPEECECPVCYWDSTSDDGMTNAVISDYRGGFYDWECTAHWTCPVCGHEFDTRESN